MQAQKLQSWDNLLDQKTYTEDNSIPTQDHQNGLIGSVGDSSPFPLANAYPCQSDLKQTENSMALASYAKQMSLNDNNYRLNIQEDEGRDKHSSVVDSQK